MYGQRRCHLFNFYNNSMKLYVIRYNSELNRCWSNLVKKYYLEIQLTTKDDIFSTSTPSNTTVNFSFCAPPQSWRQVHDKDTDQGMDSYVIHTTAQWALAHVTPSVWTRIGWHVGRKKRRFWERSWNSTSNTSRKLRLFAPTPRPHWGFSYSLPSRPPTSHQYLYCSNAILIPLASLLLRSYPNSFLVRFFGLHRVSLERILPGHKIYFVIMSSVFDTDKPLHIKYDLKGSTLGRLTPEDRCDEGDVQKDLNLTQSGTCGGPSHWTWGRVSSTTSIHHAVIGHSQDPSKWLATRIVCFPVIALDLSGRQHNVLQCTVSIVL